MKTAIINGYIYDGSKNAPVKGDLLIEDNKILSVGDKINQAELDTVDKIVDASEKMVCPGFIDAHSHNDFFCDHENAEMFFKPFIEQGITTQVTGNCSFSPFGTNKHPKHKNYLTDGLFEVHYPGSFQEFKNRLKDNLYVNIVPLVGLGSTRATMVGFGPCDFSDELIKEELEYVREAMEGGAFGGSCGFMYEPNRYAKKDEILAFAKEIAKYDGILTIHPRACSKISPDFPLLSRKSHLELGLDEVVDIMKESGCRTEYSHLIFVGKTSWPLKDKMLKVFHNEVKNGYPIAFDNYPFHYGASILTVVYPAWYASLSKKDRYKKINLLKLKATIYACKKLIGVDWSDIVIAFISDDYPEYEGKTIAQIAKDENSTCFDTYLKLVELSNRKGTIYLGKYYNEDIVRTLMTDELSVFMTDAWVEEKGHQNIAAYQAFPQFFLLAKKYGIPYQNIVNKMTGATADRFKIPNRGYLKPGYIADISIVDVDKMYVDQNKPDSKPTGIYYVFVNGKLVVDNCSYVGGCNGEIVLKKVTKLS